MTTIRDTIADVLQWCANRFEIVSYTIRPRERHTIAGVHVVIDARGRFEQVVPFDEVDWGPVPDDLPWWAQPGAHVHRSETYYGEQREQWVTDLQHAIGVSRASAVEMVTHLDRLHHAVTSDDTVDRTVELFASVLVRWPQTPHREIVEQLDRLMQSTVYSSQTMLSMINNTRRHEIDGVSFAQYVDMCISWYETEHDDDDA